MDNYISDLRATVQMGMDINVFPMNRFGTPAGQNCKEIGPGPAIASLPFVENANIGIFVK